jgi:hypothetical protein
VLTLLFLISCETDNSQATEEIIKYKVSYTADSGGYIYGQQEQEIQKGRNSIEVMAVGNTGYIFNKWSDGITSVRRNEKNIQSDISLTAYFTFVEVLVSYQTDERGYISGIAEQHVPLFGNTELVTAVPSEGYMFTHWSDGNLNPTRQEYLINNPITLVAYFEKLVRNFEYVDNFFKFPVPKEDVVIAYENFETTKFKIPFLQYYTFDGWFLDEELTIVVSDENGNILISKDIFEADSNKLYAKWHPQFSISYRFLFAFISEVQGEIEGNDVGNTFNPLIYEYLISYCEKTAQILNELFKGLIIFSIDTYSTKDPIVAESMSGSSRYGNFNFLPHQIDEFDELFLSYPSIITFGSLNDPTNILSRYSSVYTSRSAYINLNSFFEPFFYGEISFEEFLRSNGSLEKNIQKNILECFAQSVALFYNSYEINDTINQYSKLTEGTGFSTLDIELLYLLNRATLNGKPVGVPLDYWLLFGTLNDPDGVLDNYNQS